MNRAFFGLLCAVVLALPLLPTVSRAESVTYVYAALPGPIDPALRDTAVIKSAPRLGADGGLVGTGA